MGSRIRLVTNSIKKAARAKQWDAALSIFAEAAEQSAVDAVACNAIMNACVSVKKWAMAFHLLDQMVDDKVEVNKYVFATCMRAFGEATLWHVAIAKLAEQLNSPAPHIEMDAVIFGVCITHCGKAVEWKSALELLEEMRRRFVPQTEGEKLALFACERGSAWLHAMHLLEGLEDQSSYNSAISSCGKAEQWISSISLVAEMERKEIQPDEVTWNCLLSALEKGSQWQRALALLSKDISPSRMGYNATISACSHGSAWKQALDLFEQLRDADVVTFNAIITACTKGRETSRSLRLFEKMKDLAVSPDVVTLGAVLNACEKEASWAEAVSLLLQEKRPSIVLFNMVASSCGRGHQWQQALRILQEVKRQRISPDATTFNSVMAACLRGEEWQHSLSLFQDLRRLKVAPTLPSYAEILGAFHQARRWEAALQMFLQVPQPDLQVLGAALRASGTWEQALLVLDSVESDTICTLLTLSAIQQAGQGYWVAKVTQKLCRDLVKCAGDFRGAEVTAVQTLMVSDTGDSHQAKELEHFSRSVCRSVYQPALRHCRDRSSKMHSSTVDEWSSFEMASRVDLNSVVSIRAMAETLAASTLLHRIQPSN